MCGRTGACPGTPCRAEERVVGAAQGVVEARGEDHNRDCEPGVLDERVHAALPLKRCHLTANVRRCVLKVRRRLQNHTSCPKAAAQSQAGKRTLTLTPPQARRAARRHTKLENARDESSIGVIVPLRGWPSGTFEFFPSLFFSTFYRESLQQHRLAPCGEGDKDRAPEPEGKCDGPSSQGAAAIKASVTTIEMEHPPRSSSPLLSSRLASHSGPAYFQPLWNARLH